MYRHFKNKNECPLPLMAGAFHINMVFSVPCFRVINEWNILDVEIIVRNSLSGFIKLNCHLRDIGDMHTFSCLSLLSANTVVYASSSSSSGWLGRACLFLR